MITFEQQKQSVDLVNTLITKSWEDSAFKNRLIENPVSTIQSVTGINFQLSNDTKLVVEDQSDESIIYLNIPRMVDIDEMELTDEQLEGVSGGGEIWATAATIGGCIALANEIYKFGKGIYDGYKAS